MTTFSIKECLSFGWRTFTSSPLIFLGVTLLVVVANILVSAVQFAVEFLGGAIAGEGMAASTLIVLISTIIGMALSFVISLWQTMFYLRAHESVEGIEPRALWRTERYLAFVGTSLILAIVLVIGFLLLIVPGIILGTVFAFALYVVLEERLSPIEALKESARLTKGHRWKVFGLGVAIVGINILGFIALIIGLLISIPVSTLASVHAYRTLKDAQLPVAA